MVNFWCTGANSPTSPQKHMLPLGSTILFMVDIPLGSMPSSVTQAVSASYTKRVCWTMPSMETHARGPSANPDAHTPVFEYLMRLQGINNYSKVRTSQPDGWGVWFPHVPQEHTYLQTNLSLLSLKLNLQGLHGFSVSILISNLITASWINRQRPGHFCDSADKHHWQVLNQGHVWSLWREESDSGCE